MEDDNISRFNSNWRLYQEIKKSGHSKWGFTIYRCTYASDEDWEKMMDKMKAGVEEPSDNPLSHFPRLLSNTLTYTVVEDSALEGAGREEIFKRFGAWVDSEPWKIEQPSECAGTSARYDICIWIDEASLKSILNEPENYIAPEPGTWTKEEEDLVGWVYALRYYKKPLPGAEREWMRITFFDLMTRWYILLRTDGWHHEYRQHPDIAVG
ncbi:hypothetical protein BDZ85DRAFT_15743 [Elsinoe ampelina]|uniref:Uncharacterized protein n=1 Tax=Elsinoe ampelina TaxID=302913 RepID=A0A6A6G6L6_9PEZI|nr:hypothetical protein BDZ85DRAFT_15743 [Elsinoe ampelina]